MNRKQIADLILERLHQEYSRLQDFYAAQPIPYFYLDDLLPEDLAQQIRQAFPAGENMHIKKACGNSNTSPPSSTNTTRFWKK